MVKCHILRELFYFATHPIIFCIIHFPFIIFFDQNKFKEFFCLLQLREFLATKIPFTLTITWGVILNVSLSNSCLFCTLYKQIKWSNTTNTSISTSNLLKRTNVTSIFITRSLIQSLTKCSLSWTYSFLLIFPTKYYLNIHRKFTWTQDIIIYY